ncbi:MAG: alpha/beta fold hydrolase [Desulfonatronovibrio sp.]
MTETVHELAHERPVHFYDQLGCGRSDKAADPGFYSPQRYVRELAEVRQALGLSEVCLMGFSWGNTCPMSNAGLTIKQEVMT